MSRKKKKKKIFWVYFTLVLAFLIYVCLIDSASFLKRHLTVKENKKYRELIIAQEKENERLKHENKLLVNSKKKIEEKARDMGMQKKNEEIFIFKEENNKELDKKH